MSQLLQVHIANQRLLKASGENSPASPGLMGSPGTMSPISMGPSSPQGMPIPRRIGIGQEHGWIMNPGISLSGGTITTNGGGGGGGYNMLEHNMDSSFDLPIGLGMGMDPMTMEGELSKLSMAVDDDDIFKVNRSELLGPTLAELNAPDADTLLDGLNFDDLYWPVDGSNHSVPEATPSPQTPAGGLDPDVDIVFQIHTSSSFPSMGNPKMLGISSSVPNPTTILEQTLLQPSLIMNDMNVGVMNHAQPSTSNHQPSSSSNSGGLRELLLRRELQNSLESPESASPLGQSLPRSVMSTTPSMTTRLSSSAPTGQGNVWESWQQRREAVWQRRDPRPHLLSTGSLAEGGSTSSLSADVLSPGCGLSLSMDEGFDSDQLSDGDSSDEESELSDTESNAGSTSGTRRERFFWQYNVQAKGPKGQRLVLAPTQEDPHVLQKPTDPVFSPLCHIQGIKHSGKARKGDGNDLTPNPRKLWAIGKELDRLNKVIAEMTPVADLPNAVKSRSRKEKNKLASRACRLKKKAQHEANKLKLYGLEQEHKRLMAAIEQSRQLVFGKLDGTLTDVSEPISVKVDRISKYGTRHRIGGHTTEFVNKVLEKVKQGVPDGGINDL